MNYPGYDSKRTYNPPVQAIDERHIEAQRAWSLRTFGPGRRTKGITEHIVKELIEVAENPDSVDEWVDLIILALDGAWRTGATPDRIIRAVKDKQRENERRTWPDWREGSEDHAIEHVR